MWMFGDVWSTPEECSRLAKLISDGLGFKGVVEDRSTLLHLNGNGWHADVLAMAVIGHRGGVMVASELLNGPPDDPTSESEKRKYRYRALDDVARITGVSREILARTVRWHGVDQMSVREIVERLLSA